MKKKIKKRTTAKRIIKLRKDYRFIDGLLIGMLFTVAVLVFIFSIYLEKEKDLTFNSGFENVTEIKEIIKNCENKTLIESAQCVNAHILQFFKYNISNLGKEINFSELKKTGGICSDWSSLYCSIFDEMGFETKIITMKTGKTNITINNKTEELDRLHENCLISDSTAWAIADQKSLFTFKFAPLNQSELEAVYNKKEKDL